MPSAFVVSVVDCDPLSVIVTFGTPVSFRSRTWPLIVKVDTAATTVVSMLMVLLAGTGSVTFEDATSVLPNVPRVGWLRMTVPTADPPGTIVPSVTVTTPATGVAPPVAEMNVDALVKSNATRTGPEGKSVLVFVTVNV